MLIFDRRVPIKCIPNAVIARLKLFGSIVSPVKDRMKTEFREFCRHLQAHFIQVPYQGVFTVNYAVPNIRGICCPSRAAMFSSKVCHRNLGKSIYY